MPRCPGRNHRGQFCVVFLILLYPFRFFTPLPPQSKSSGIRGTLSGRPATYSVQRPLHQPAVASLLEPARQAPLNSLFLIHFGTSLKERKRNHIFDSSAIVHPYSTACPRDAPSTQTYVQPLQTASNLNHPKRYPSSSLSRR